LPSIVGLLQAVLRKAVHARIGENNAMKYTGLPHAVEIECGLPAQEGGGAYAAIACLKAIS
jgi:hypothetical protein